MSSVKKRKLGVSQASFKKELVLCPVVYSTSFEDKPTEEDIEEYSSDDHSFVRVMKNTLRHQTLYVTSKLLAPTPVQECLRTALQDAIKEVTAQESTKVTAQESTASFSELTCISPWTQENVTK